MRKGCKHDPDPDLYAHKLALLAELEQLSKKGLIDLFYGDETHICSEGYVPYGWQFPDEEVYTPVAKGYKINVWGLVSRDNRLHYATTEENIDATFVFNQLEDLSLNIDKQTVLALDNASVHRAKIIQAQLPFWEERGLYIFYLPPYSPNLNIAETLWRKIKKEQIDPADYTDKDTLFHTVKQCLAQFGNIWTIKFSDFNIN